MVLGRNGSGKSSLLRIASLYLHPSEGTVDVLGQRLGRTDVRVLRTRIGVASSGMADMLRSDLTPVDVVMTAKNAALEPWWHHYDDADRARAVTCLEQLGIGHLAHRSFATLSSGERQRVLLARTLMPEPGLLLLDEPTAGLDLAGREDLVAGLADLAADPTTPATVLVTHHVEEIPRGFTHLLLLAEGRVHGRRPARRGARRRAPLRLLRSAARARAPPRPMVGLVDPLTRGHRYDRRGCRRVGRRPTRPNGDLSSSAPRSDCSPSSCSSWSMGSSSRPSSRWWPSTARRSTTPPNRAAAGPACPRGLLRHLSFHLSGAQLGITVTSLLIGFLAEPAVASVLEPVLEPIVGEAACGAVSLALALFLATVVQMVVGELVPKGLAIARPERTTFLLAPVRAHLRADLRPGHPLPQRRGQRARSACSASSRRRSCPTVRYAGRARSWSSRPPPRRAPWPAPPRAADPLDPLRRARPRPTCSCPAPRSSRWPVDATVADLVGAVGRDRATPLPGLRGRPRRRGRAWCTCKAAPTPCPRRRGPRPPSDLMAASLAVPRPGTSTTSWSTCATRPVPPGGRRRRVRRHRRHRHPRGRDRGDRRRDRRRVRPLPGAASPAAAAPASGWWPARLHPDEVFDATGFEVPDGEYETLAGFVLDQLGPIPEVGESIEHDGWTVEVAEMDRRRVAEVAPPARSSRGQARPSRPATGPRTVGA